MLTHIRQRLSFANVTSTLALFVALSTGTAYAAGYVVSSNKDVAANTISGHKPPAGDHANLIPGSITAADLSAPDAWHVVAPNPQQVNDPCSQNPAILATLCGSFDQRDFWANAGGPFAPAAYTRDLQGRVEVRGLVSIQNNRPFRGGGTGSYIFLLPSGYRPAHELVFTALDNDANGSYLVRLDVRPDGAIQVYNDMSPRDQNGLCTCSQFVSLDGISFRTDA